MPHLPGPRVVGAANGDAEQHQREHGRHDRTVVGRVVRFRHYEQHPLVSAAGCHRRGAGRPGCEGRGCPVTAAPRCRAVRSGPVLHRSPRDDGGPPAGPRDAAGNVNPPQGVVALAVAPDWAAGPAAGRGCHRPGSTTPTGAPAATYPNRSATQAGTTDPGNGSRAPAAGHSPSGNAVPSAATRGAGTAPSNGDTAPATRGPPPGMVADAQTATGAAGPHPDRYCHGPGVAPATCPASPYVGAAGAASTGATGAAAGCGCHDPGPTPTASPPRTSVHAPGTPQERCRTGAGHSYRATATCTADPGLAPTETAPGRAASTGASNCADRAATATPADQTPGPAADHRSPTSHPTRTGRGDHASAATAGHGEASGSTATPAAPTYSATAPRHGHRPCPAGRSPPGLAAAPQIPGCTTCARAGRRRYYPVVAAATRAPRPHVAAPQTPTDRADPATASDHPSRGVGWEHRLHRGRPNGR